MDDVWVKDLGTDRAIYDVDLVYDRNSNIVRLDDHVHPTKFDAVYTMDNLDRLTDAQEGDLNGGSTIATEARQQTWTLEQTGNWELEKLDLNGDGDWGDADEHQDDRTHNAVNELTARDTDDNGSDNYTLVYDEAGNLIDDGEAYKYEYDCFHRLRRIRNQSAALVAEYRYNGLGYRIAEHIDTTGNGTVDGSDAWHHFAHDERWRVVGMFIDSSTDPEEQYVHHAAGTDGFGGASYIDELVLRDRDAVTDINNALDERLYYLQNRHFDVVALVDDTGKQVEMVRYSAYGVPFGLPGGDCDSDGDNDSIDHAQIQTWMSASVYDVRGDLDLDGDLDATDHSMAQNGMYMGSLGRRVLSGGAANRFGLAAYSRGAVDIYGVRSRDYHSTLGYWLQRDPLNYVDSMGLYAYVSSRPLYYVDSFGLQGGGGDWPDGFKPVYHPGGIADKTLEELDAVSEIFDEARRAGWRAAEKTPGGSRYYGLPNAIQHCVASCLAARRYGEDAAELGGEVVEWLEFFLDTAREREMDRTNNAVGRDCAKKVGFWREYSSCERCCEKSASALDAYDARTDPESSRPNPVTPGPGGGGGGAKGDGGGSGGGNGGAGGKPGSTPGPVSPPARRVPPPAGPGTSGPRAPDCPAGYVRFGTHGPCIPLVTPGPDGRSVRRSSVGHRL